MRKLFDDDDKSSFFMSSTNSAHEASEEVVLSFYDVLLRRSDVSLLDGPFWLNDLIIAFAYEYFTQRRFSDLVDKVAFVTPSIVQLTKFFDEATSSGLLEPLNLREKVLLFFPINDSQSSASVAGTHWSLLAYRRVDNCFYHFDSVSKSGNFDIASSVAKKLSVAIDCGTKANVVPVACAVQRNGYDCGVFCILFTERLAGHFRQKGDEVLPKIKDVAPETISNYRAELKSIIETLRLGGD